MLPPEDVELDEDSLLLFTGLDDALIGTTDSFSSDGTRPRRAVYSAEKIIELFATRDGMTDDEAVEFIEFNMSGAYVGPNTPVVVWPLLPVE